MILAHTADAAGPQVEFLLVGAALVVLSVIFFVQRSVKPVVSVVLLLGGFAVAGGAFIVDGEAPASTHATVRILSPEGGATVPANEPVTVQIELTDGTLTPEETSDDPHAGHLHLSVNGRLVAMPLSTEMQVELEEGANLIEVEFTRANHTSFEPAVTDAIEVTAE